MFRNVETYNINYIRFNLNNRELIKQFKINVKENKIYAQVALTYIFSHIKKCFINIQKITKHMIDGIHRPF